MRLQLATAGCTPARDAAGCLVLVGLALLKQPRSENVLLALLEHFVLFGVNETAWWLKMHANVKLIFPH